MTMANPSSDNVLNTTTNSSLATHLHPTRLFIKTAGQASKGYVAKSAALPVFAYNQAQTLQKLTSQKGVVTIKPSAILNGFEIFVDTTAFSGVIVLNNLVAEKYPGVTT